MFLGFPVALVVKNLPANAGDIRDTVSIPGSGRSTGEGNDNPLQYSCLENPMDRGAWQAIVCRVAKSRTWLKWLSTAHNLCSQGRPFQNQSFNKEQKNGLRNKTHFILKTITETFQKKTHFSMIVIVCFHHTKKSSNYSKSKFCLKDMY